MYRISRAYFLSPTMGLGSLVDCQYGPTGETFGMWPETQHFGQIVKLHHF